MTDIILEKGRNYVRVISSEDVELLAKVSNSDIEKIREIKFEKMKDELTKTIPVTADDIKQAIKEGIVKPAETEDEMIKNLKEKGYGKYADIITKHLLVRKHVEKKVSTNVSSRTAK